MFIARPNHRSGAQPKHIAKSGFVVIIQDKIRVYLVENNILPTLRGYNTRPLKDIRKIALGCTVLLALRRPLGQLDGVHFRPPHLAPSKGHPGTYNTDRPLYDLKSREGTNKPLHEPEVAAADGFGRP